MSIAEDYKGLANDRTPYEDRAEECASLTLPYAFPDDSLKGQDNLEREFVQGFGAMLVNHFVGKLALTILPPSQPFFRLSATQEAMDRVAGNDPEAKFEIERIIATKEEAALRAINKTDFRASLYPSLRQSVVTGNSFIEKVEDSGYKVHGLRNYVVKRDHKGVIIRLILEEKMAYETIPEEITLTDKDADSEDDVSLFTSVDLVDGSYVITQEILEQPVGTETKLKALEERFIDATWNRLDGEDYGRGFVEDHLGTLFVLNKLLKVVTEGIAEGVKIVKLVNPNGLTSYSDYVSAKHGDAIIGKDGDVTTLQSGKSMDLSVAKELINEMKQELSRAFLVTGASIRDSERTTAYEVDKVANEVEASLGGLYTKISGNIQRPVVSQSLIGLKIETGKDIDIIITTGLQALGRNVELNKINTLIQELQMLAGIVGPEAIAKEVNVAAISSAMVSNSGVASKDFLYTQKEKDAMREQAQKDQAAQQVLQGGLPQAGANIANQMNQGEQQ